MSQLLHQKQRTVTVCTISPRGVNADIFTHTLTSGVDIFGYHLTYRITVV